MSTNSLKLLPALLLLGGLLTACSNEIGVDENPPELPPVVEPDPTQIDIQNTDLPIIETFDATNAVEFFDPSYKLLTTPASNPIVDDDGNTFSLVDPWPSFYYPTCCFFQTDPGTGQVIHAPPFDPEMDSRLIVGSNKMALSNARFTVGQILSDLTPPTVVDRKRDTTVGAAELGASLKNGSWGELNLTEPYRVSFCLNDFGISGAGASNLEVWVDNNGGGRSQESIHLNAALVLRAAVTGSGVALARGRRVVVDVPGDAYMVDNNGNRVGATLGVIQPLDGNSLPVGTLTSFLQLRVSSGGFAVISDLVIEYQDQNNAASLPACAPDTNFFDPPSASEIREAENLPGTPYDPADYTPPVILEVDATAGEAEFFAQLGAEIDAGLTTGNYLAISDNQYDNFYKEVGSPGRIFVDATNNAVRFGNALWTAGLREGAQDDGVNVNGDIDLTQAYRITMEILELPLEPNYRLQVQIDNNSGTGSASVHGAASRIANLVAGDGLATGTLVINVPGEITMNGVQLTSMNGTALPDPNNAVPALVGTATSFIAFRCPSECVDTNDNPQVTQDSAGIVLGDIVVEYQ